MPAPWQRHGRWTTMPGPAATASDTGLRLQAWIWPYAAACRALNPCDNSITSDQNCHKLLLFQLLRDKNCSHVQHASGSRTRSESTGCTLPFQTPLIFQPCFRGTFWRLLSLFRSCVLPEPSPARRPSPSGAAGCCRSAGSSLKTHGKF